MIRYADLYLLFQLTVCGLIGKNGPNAPSRAMAEKERHIDKNCHWNKIMGLNAREVIQKPRHAMIVRAQVFSVFTAVPEF